MKRRLTKYCNDCKTHRTFNIHPNDRVIIPNYVLVKVSCMVCHIIYGHKFTLDEWEEVWNENAK